MAALVMKKDSPVRPKYLYYYLWRHKEDKLVSLMSGTANTSLTLTDLDGVEITYPPLETQDAIVGVIDGVLEEAKIVEKEINILAGRQATLFSDVLDACIDTPNNTRPKGES